MVIDELSQPEILSPPRPTDNALTDYPNQLDDITIFINGIDKSQIHPHF